MTSPLFPFVYFGTDMNTIKLDTIALARIRIEDLATDVLTLTEGLDADDIARSRLTRAALTRRLRQIADIAQDLPEDARAAMPEVAWAQWQTLGAALRNGTEDAEMSWRAANELCTETLQWMRVYREEAAAARPLHDTPPTSTPRALEDVSR